MDGKGDHIMLLDVMTCNPAWSLPALTHAALWRRLMYAVINA
jgi:hypothetical protein